jgi:hypothetical protein
MQTLFLRVQIWLMQSHMIGVQTFRMVPFYSSINSDDDTEQLWI